jgi:hypothetical protein
MTRRPLALRLFLAALCAAGVAHAGTVYVPSPGTGTIGASSYEVQVSITNSSAVTAPVSQVLLPTDTDGSTGRPTPTTVQVQAGRTAVVKPGGSFKGLLEMTGSADLRYSARLAGTGPGRLGVYLPVITSDNLIRGGQTAVLQGLVSGAGRTADLTVVNLGQGASQCSASLYQADGTLLAGPVSLAMKPLSHRTIADIFSGGIATEARVTVICARDFFAYVLLSDAATGEIAYVGPAGNGGSLLTLPGQGPACPAGATCFDAKGVVHQPTQAKPVQRVSFPAPAGVATRLRMSLDVTVGPWYAPDPAGKHLIYWFVVNRNFIMPGMLYFRGPDQYNALVRHGINLTHPQKIKITQPFQAIPGHTYHVDNDYDMARGVYAVTVTDAATSDTVQLVGAPNVRSYTLKAGDNFLIDMGFVEGLTPDEVPTYGWTYANVHVEVYK